VTTASTTKAKAKAKPRAAACDGDLWVPARGEISLAEVMKALGDPTRLRIVRTLAEKGMDGCTGGATTEASKQLLSHHIRVLREAGLIECWYEGRNKYARLRFADLEAEFPGLLASVTSSLRRRRIGRSAKRREKAAS
jgi:DNA-binding transcriptional ArsR family regulator